MALPLRPLILIGTGVVTAASGVVLGLKGGYEINKANGRIRVSGEMYDEERRKLQAHEDATNESLAALGNRQEQATREVIERMAAFLRRHEKQVSETEKLLADGLEPSPGRVAIKGNLGQDAVSWARGILGSAATGVGVNAGVTTAVTTFASASTGTAISSLSGAAATNATLGFLGGGSLASGGGGMAAGAAVLNSVTIGPAILVSGLLVAGQGEKAKTNAHENEALVNVAIAELHSTKVKFEAVVARAEELGTLLEQLVGRAVATLDLLESEPFVPSSHAARFQDALTLTVAVRDVASTQVVDDSGDLNYEAAGLKMRYRTLTKGATDE